MPRRAKKSNKIIYDSKKNVNAKLTDHSDIVKILSSPDNNPGTLRDTLVIWAQGAPEESPRAPEGDTWIAQWRIRTKSGDEWVEKAIPKKYLRYFFNDINPDVHKENPYNVPMESDRPKFDPRYIEMYNARQEKKSTKRENTESRKRHGDLVHPQNVEESRFEPPIPGDLGAPLTPEQSKILRRTKCPLGILYNKKEPTAKIRKKDDDERELPCDQKNHKDEPPVPANGSPKVPSPQAPVVALPLPEQKPQIDTPVLPAIVSIWINEWWCWLDDMRIQMLSRDMPSFIVPYSTLFGTKEDDPLTAENVWDRFHKQKDEAGYDGMALILALKKAFFCTGESTRSRSFSVRTQWLQNLKKWDERNDAVIQRRDKFLDFSERVPIPRTECQWEELEDVFGGNNFPILLAIFHHMFPMQRRIPKTLSF